MGFAARSLLMLSVLSCMVFAVGDFALLHRQAPIWMGAILVAVLVGATQVMRWDLAAASAARAHESGSVRPLTIMQLSALQREAAVQGQSAGCPLPREKRARWAGFPVEFLFWAAPLICGFLLVSWVWIGKELERMGVVLPAHIAPWLLVAVGVAWAVRIDSRYRGEFRCRQVKDLTQSEGATRKHPLAVEIEGEIVGNGLPGAFWNSDLVLKDETGLMFLHYRSSIPFGRLLFAFRSADRFIGERVHVQGWYRSGIKPYIEIARIEAQVPKASAVSEPVSLFGKQGAKVRLEYERLVEYSHSRWLQLMLSASCSAFGLIWLLGNY
jgi:hypothetical protein